ncbi:hypothetical protein NQZ68_004133 [Dissostichus eleginoides]|nr:hypothetical protein NQZ68_004133 [Dissostichus eleginoides]
MAKHQRTTATTVIAVALCGNGAMMAQVHTHSHTLDVQPSWTSLEAVQGRLGCSQANPLKSSTSSETQAEAKAWGQADRAVDCMQAEVQHIPTAPTGLEVILNPQLRAPRAHTLT